MARNQPGASFESPVTYTGLVNRETLAAGKTLVIGDASWQRLDPGGAGRTVVLPAEEGANGLWYKIINAADAAEDLTINNDAAGTIGTVSQNECAWFTCDGTSWTLEFIATGAIS